MSDSKVCKWFVAKTKAKQEKSIAKQIEETGVECFVPTKIEIRDWHDRKKKVETVLIPNTVFVHACKQTAIDLHNENGLQISYLRDIAGKNPNALLVVPDGQMNEFIKFLEITDNHFQVDNDVMYVKGDKVIVTQGPFKGITGELFRLDGGEKVVVKIDNLIACSVNVTIDSIEKLTN